MVLTMRMRHRISRDDGFSTLELIVVFPFLMAMVLLMVGFGRYTHGKQLVEQAAAAAARTAALATGPDQARDAATREAGDTLAGAGVSCQQVSVSVDTGQFRAGGQVSVTVTCSANLSDLTVVGFPGSKTLTATATAPLDRYRQTYGS